MGQNLATLQSYVFVSFPQITFKLGTFTDFKVFFLSMLTDFANWIQSKVEKTVDGSIGITYRGSFSASRPFALIALKFLSQSGTV